MKCPMYCKPKHNLADSAKWQQVSYQGEEMDMAMMPKTWSVLVAVAGKLVNDPQQPIPIIKLPRTVGHELSENLERDARHN